MNKKNWQDIVVREDNRGYHYLLQMRVYEDGRKKFKNRCIDNTLFHGFQNIVEKLINKNNE